MKCLLWPSYECRGRNPASCRKPLIHHLLWIARKETWLWIEQAPVIEAVDLCFSGRPGRVPSCTMCKGLASKQRSEWTPGPCRPLRAPAGAARRDGVGVTGPPHNGGVGKEQSLGKAWELGAGICACSAHLSAGDSAHSHAEIQTSFRCQDDLAWKNGSFCPIECVFFSSTLCGWL